MVKNRIKKAKKLVSKENYLEFFNDKKLLFAPWAAEDKFFGAYQYFYSPLKNIFGEVVIFDPKKEIAIFGRDQMNLNFLEVIRKEQPDFVFIWLIYDEFSLNTLFKIKEICPKTKLINFFGDDDSLFDRFSRYYYPIIDYCLVFPQLTQETYLDNGIKNVFFTCGINRKTFDNLNLKKEYDVTFIGTPKSDRMEKLEYLIDHGINVRIFGSGWSNYPKFKNFYGGSLSNEDLVKVINKTKINISFSLNYQRKNHMKGRVFEISGCKSFLLSQEFPNADRFFDIGKELVLFKDNEDLLKKVKYYLKNEKEREQIAERGYKRVIKDYDFSKELNEFFNKIINNEFKNDGFNINKKVINLNINKLNYNSNKLISLVKDFDYVSFYSDNVKFSKYKNKIQAYSLCKTNKPISYCKFNFYSSNIGVYASVNSYDLFKYLGKKKFSKFLNLNLMMVRTDFFIHNINLFINLSKGKEVLLINEENTAFVNLSLVQFKNFDKKYSNLITNPIELKFLQDLSSLIFQRKILFSLYLYKLIFESLQGKMFILKAIYNNYFINQKYQKRLFNVIFKNEKYYEDK